MRTCVRMSYVELHAHSAFSFLDGASLPEELVDAAVERGHTALALTDHDTISGSMEFAQAARAFGLRAIHGASSPSTATATSRCSCVTTAGWRNLCRLLTRAHAHTRETPGRRRTIEKPSVSLDDARGARRGTGLPVGLRAPRDPRRADDAAAARGLRARRVQGRAAAAVRPPRPHAEPGAGGAGGTTGRAMRGDRRRARPLAGARPAPGRLRGDPRAHDARRLRAAAARQPRPRARDPGGDGRSLRRPPGRGG